MGRPIKNGVDYFSHDTDACNGKTIFTLESRYGNDGYAFWFKLLEILGSQDNLRFDCNDETDWIYLVSKTRVSEEMAKEILDLLARLDAIDNELWSNRIIYCEKFVERLEPVYRKRGVSVAETRVSVTETRVSVAESTQRKGKERKGKESKVEERKGGGKETPPPSGPLPPSSSLYGKFNNVELSPDQHESIKAAYQDYRGLIDKVSSIIEKSPKKNHYSYIITIAEQDGYKPKPKPREPDQIEPVNAVPMPENLKKKIDELFIMEV